MLWPSSELSQWDGSDEALQYMVSVRNREIYLTIIIKYSLFLELCFEISVIWVNRNWNVNKTRKLVPTMLFDIKGYFEISMFEISRRWSGGAMVLGKFPVQGRPTILMIVGQGPIALAVGAGGGSLDIFTLLFPFSPLYPSLWETAWYRLKYCL